MRSEKAQLAEDVAKLLVGAKFAYFVTYKGLKVKELNAFRASLAKDGAECHVLKNRIIRKVAELKGISPLANYKPAGDPAVVLGQGDTAQPPRRLNAAPARRATPAKPRRSSTSSRRIRRAFSRRKAATWKARS